MTTLSETAPLSVHRLLGTRRGNDVMSRIEPRLPSRISGALADGSRTVMMLGPAEWLVLDQEPKGPVDRMIEPEQPFLVFDESDAWRLFRLQGEDAADIVTQFCPIDAGADSGFKRSACATHLAKHPAIVMPRSAGEIAILVPRSYATSLFALVSDAITRSVLSETVCAR